MVAVLSVCNLQARFPLRLLAVRSIWLPETWTALLEEIRHKANLECKGGGRRSVMLLVTQDIFLLVRGNQGCKRGKAGNCDYICLEGSVQSF